jgi:hypothetical protein
MLFFFLCAGYTPATEAMPLSFENDKFCTPVGSKELAMLVTKPDQRELALKKDLAFGPITIPKGCTLYIDYGVNRTYKETNEELDKTRYISGITCRPFFFIAGVRLVGATFAENGCMDSIQGLYAEDEHTFCGKPHFEGTVYFDNGKLDCTGKKKLQEQTPINDR